MKNFRYFLFLALTGVGASAQPAFTRDNASEQAAPQQRRTDLRLALMAPRLREAQSQGGVPEEGAVQRHLSDQDRANLRQQLRQQRRDGKSDRP
jgi:hypothetical protein